MKARRVKGLDPDAPVEESLTRILRVRLDELYSFDPAVRDPKAVAALHDMRIAAKRLRYVLELAVPVFGERAKEGARDARRLQDLLGEIHDCDELLPWTRRHAKALRREDAQAVRAAASDPDELPLGERPNGDRYRGVEAVAAYAAARRGLLYERFLAAWTELAEQGFRERVLA